MLPDPVLKTVFVDKRPTARQLRKGRIVVVDGSQAGQSVVIERQRLRIGRSIVNDLTIDDQSVSGVHAEILSTEKGLLLRDLGSTNGTWVGEIRLIEGLISPNACFRTGNSTLRYESLADMVEIPLAKDDRFGSVIGASVVMREIFATLQKVAPSDLTVLIDGETGTGKEVVAHAVHGSSRRSKGPFVVLDCSAIPRDLCESILFGHEKGAFTGAVGSHKGAFEQADGGTIFLDEIGELPMELQPKLLRVLESHELKRVGGSRTIKVDVRLVVATNRDLRRMVADSQFREDLYFRLAVIHLELPALRKRIADLPLLVQHFLGQVSNPRFGDVRCTVSAQAMTKLKRHGWPGNVRELRNLVERAVSLADSPELQAEDFFPPHYERSNPAASTSTPAAEQPAAAVDPSQRFKEAKQEILDAWESRYLAALFEAHDGNISASARASGLTRYHLRELLKKHGLTQSRASSN